MLQGYYQEHAMLSELVLQKTQVRNLVPMILHARTKDVVADLICSSEEARENLTNILVCRKDGTLRSDYRFVQWRNQNDGKCSSDLQAQA